MSTLVERQESTFKEMCECLEEDRLCCVVRPTGFGKTKLFMDYVNLYPEAQFLYIYDSKSALASIERNYNPKNVEFLSYYAISRESSRETVMATLCDAKWHTIIFDEAHLMGGSNIKEVLEKVLPSVVQKGIRVLGGTATKIRTDLLDVANYFFQDCTPYEYTLLDAIDDGIMLEPVWALTAHYKELLNSLHERFDGSANSYMKQELRQLDKAYADIDGVSSVYRSVVEQVYTTAPRIMRFIVFYPTVKAIDDNYERDISEFQKAFPKHKVVFGRLSSSEDHFDTVVEVEKTFSGRGKQVQLIFAVNMLNQAYHSDTLTGIVMYRSTLSNIIFTQELGRVMSVMAKFRGIVFDNVGNAFMQPDTAMQVIRVTDDTEKSNTGGTRDHIDVRVRASKELVAFQKVYDRIMATSKMTQIQIDNARKNWEKHKYHMSWEDFYAITGIPEYVIKGD